ncbi:MAG TPA: 3-isopropylmalate dehydratase small subunit [Rhodanobacteraceae bacterium]|jgi:3-isopropylmalate/(R)-2-methylmalate dehydratase small subunit
MKPFTRLTSVVAPLLRDNVDTDCIIPAEFMRSLSTDPGRGLFARWRYRPDGSEEPSFVLNDPRFRNAAILLSGANFGCGSSRENAVWALDRFGIRCVIARGFSDIFYGNCFKNGVLPVKLPQAAHERLAAEVQAQAVCEASVDLRLRQIALPSGSTIEFDLDARRQAQLLSGEDEIAATLRRQARIDAFRHAHAQRSPWLYRESRGGGG